MTAPSPTEQATLARIEAADPAEESLRERVARAIQANKEVFPPAWETLSRLTKYHYCRMADAAIAVMRGE